jgi:hypothetical protein
MPILIHLFFQIKAHSQYQPAVSTNSRLHSAVFSSLSYDQQLFVRLETLLTFCCKLPLLSPQAPIIFIYFVNNKLGWVISPSRTGSASLIELFSQSIIGFSSSNSVASKIMEHGSSNLSSCLISFAGCATSNYSEREKACAASHNLLNLK